MDCQLSISPFPAIRVLEMLAHSNQVDVSLLLDLLEKYPQISDDLGRNAREFVSLKILESFLAQGAQSNSVSLKSCPKIGFDPSELCEDVVLQRILFETSGSERKSAGSEMWKWNVEPCIVHKRFSMAEGCNSYRGTLFSFILEKAKWFASGEAILRVEFKCVRIMAMALLLAQ